MSIRIISKEELAVWEEHPAKQYIRVPLSGVVMESLDAEDKEWLLKWREEVARWVETEEAACQARVVNEAAAVLARERSKLHQMCSAATKTDGDMFPSVRRKKALK